MLGKDHGAGRPVLIIAVMGDCLIPKYNYAKAWCIRKGHPFYDMGRVCADSPECQRLAKLGAHRDSPYVIWDTRSENEGTMLNED